MKNEKEKHSKKYLNIKMKKNSIKIKEYEIMNEKLNKIKELDKIEDLVKEDDEEYYYEEVYEIRCENCDNLIEVNNTDTEVTCLNCGSIIEIDWD